MRLQVKYVIEELLPNFQYVASLLEVELLANLLCSWASDCKSYDCHQVAVGRHSKGHSE